MNHVWYPFVALACRVSMGLTMRWMRRGRRRPDREDPTGEHGSRGRGDAADRDPDGVRQPSLWRLVR